VAIFGQTYFSQSSTQRNEEKKKKKKLKEWYEIWTLLARWIVGERPCMQRRETKRPPIEDRAKIYFKKLLLPSRSRPPVTDTWFHFLLFSILESITIHNNFSVLIQLIDSLWRVIFHLSPRFCFLMLWGRFSRSQKWKARPLA
jgi:hypothetical protein